MTASQESIPKKSKLEGFNRRIHEIGLISRDPILMIALIFSFIFLIIFIFYPIMRTIVRGFVSDTGQADLTQFARYFDGTIFDGFIKFLKTAGLILQETVKYGRTYRLVFSDTIKMGLMSATSGTIVGFIFAYATVRSNFHCNKIIHILS